MSAHPWSTQCFVVPSLSGPISGGTLYNRELCRALEQLGAPTSVAEITQPRLLTALAEVDWVWVDSLYLAAVPDLVRASPGRVGLLAHYLPSFVRCGRAARPLELSGEERDALSCANAFLVTSAFMREALAALVGSSKPTLVAYPGSHARLSPEPPNPSPGLRALMIGNVVPGKGLEALLRALAKQLQAADSFELWVVGSLTFDAAYAGRCQRLIAESPMLVDRVKLLGACSPEHTLRLLAEAELLISASCMESFGMALAEARIVGTPILACAGGNAAAHVSVEAGGQLVDTPEALAAAGIELARAPGRVRQRVGQARSHASPARTWAETARRLLDQLACLER